MQVKFCFGYLQFRRARYRMTSRVFTMNFSICLPPVCLYHTGSGPEKGRLAGEHFLSGEMRHFRDRKTPQAMACGVVFAVYGSKCSKIGIQPSARAVSYSSLVCSVQETPPALNSLRQSLWLKEQLRSWNR